MPLSEGHKAVLKMSDGYRNLYQLVQRDGWVIARRSLSFGGGDLKVTLERDGEERIVVVRGPGSSVVQMLITNREPFPNPDEL